MQHEKIVQADLKRTKNIHEIELKRWKMGASRYKHQYLIEL